MRIYEIDILIIGAGAAGCRAAIEAVEIGAKVVLVCKGPFGRCGTTNLAGVVFAAGLGHTDSRDNSDIHLTDTVIEGRFLGNQRLIKLACDGATKAVYDLERYGMPWYKQPDGKYYQLPTPGHRYDRGVHFDAITGRMVQQALVQEVLRSTHYDITIHEDTFVLDLVVEKGEVLGAVVLDMGSGEVSTIAAKCTILATGGTGHMYRYTDMNRGATGDGVALAFRHGARLVSPEMHQFFPTAFVYPESLAGIAVATSALWKYDLRLYNELGERFMEKYDPVNKDNVPRDILSRGIFTEIMEGRGTEHGGVWMTTEFIDREYWKKVRKDRARSYIVPKRFGVNTDRFEIAPTYHFTLGGLEFNERGETNLRRLLVAGEAAGGIHGANRIGGNALAECLVFGEIVGRVAAGYRKEVSLTLPKRSVSRISGRATRKAAASASQWAKRPLDVLSELQNLMYRHLGIVRTKEGMCEAVSRISDLKKTVAALSVKPGSVFNYDLIELFELENMLLLAEACVKGALRREESRGAHFRSDYPDNDKWLKYSVAQYRDGEIRLDWKPVDFLYVSSKGELK